MPNNQRPILIGAATSAYQIEGSTAADGRGPCVWDTFAQIPGKIANNESGEIACDHYRRWQDDLTLMGELNLQAYRLSLSWPRIFPAGRGEMNSVGLDFYERLIDGLLAAEIVPSVTLYHWDLPTALQFELGGWTSSELPAIFADYAEVVFERLGDRVLHWCTLNEPWVVARYGFQEGTHPPGIKSQAAGYRAGHELLRAHGMAVERFRAGSYPGEIGLALNSTFTFPESDSPADIEAAERAMLHFAGWFGDPVIFGDYPTVLRDRLGDLLPEFSSQDSKRLMDSMDYVGINYYTSDWARANEAAGPLGLDRFFDSTSPRSAMDWPVMPEGCRLLLEWLHHRYQKPLYVLENGIALDDEVGADGSVTDPVRIDYLKKHFAAMRQAVANGVDLRGVFVWTLMDNLEWSEGYAKRFGLVRCDVETQRRTVKASGRWLAEFIADGGFDTLGG